MSGQIVHVPIVTSALQVEVNSKSRVVIVNQCKSLGTRLVNIVLFGLLFSGFSFRFLKRVC